jgi:zinc protease
MAWGAAMAQLCLAGTSLGAIPGVQEATLPNGLRVITREVRTAPVVSVWVWYRVGSRNEPIGATGVSHMLEHMMFKGTPSLPPGSIDRLVSLAGGSQNAFTSYDYTAYHITLPSASLDLALRIEADRMVNATLDPDELGREKQVVLSELRGRENNPQALLSMLVQGTALQAHPYRWPIIGWRSDVEAYAREAVVDHYRRFYQPNNAILVLVGDFDTASALERVRHHFGGIPRGAGPPPVLTREPDGRGERRVTLKVPSRTPFLQVAYHVPAAGDPDLYPLAVLDAALTTGRSSRLHRALVDRGLAVAARSYLPEQIDPSLWHFYLTPAPGVARERLEAALFGALEEVGREPIGDDELARVKRQIRADFTYAQDSLTSQARTIGAVATVRDLAFLQTYLDRIERVTREEVRRVAAAYLQADRRTVGWLEPLAVPPGQAVRSGPPTGPLHDRPAGAAPAPTAAPATAEPTAPTLRVGPIGLEARARRIVLPNGLTLLVLPNPGNATVHLRGSLRAGAMFDPPGQGGLANLTAGLLLRGAGGRDASQVAEALESVGAELAFTTQNTAATFSGKALAADLERLLDVLADALRRPTFPGPEVAKAKDQIRVGIRRGQDSPSTVAWRSLIQALYPAGHPLHGDPAGTEAEVSALGEADARAFHARHYGPAGTVLVIVGAVDPEAARAMVERRLGDWQSPPGAPAYAVPSGPTVMAATEIVVPVPGRPEAIIRMGGPGVVREQPGYFAALVANRIVGGGGLGTRLMRALRDREGLTYAVYSYFSAAPGERPWLLLMQTDAGKAREAAARLRAELQAAAAAPVTADELAMAKASLLGLFLRSLEASGDLASLLLDLEIHRLGLGYPDRFARGVEAVTPEEVGRALASLVRLDRLVTVIAGPPSN